MVHSVLFYKLQRERIFFHPRCLPALWYLYTVATLRQNISVKHLQHKENTFFCGKFHGKKKNGTPLTALQDVGFPEERYFMWLHHTDQVLLPDTIYLSPSTGQKSLSLPYRVAFPSPARDFRSRSSPKAVSQEQQNGRGWKVRVSLRWWW